MWLWQTRQHWEKLARQDPFWAVLAAPDKRGRRWQIDEFFATGVAEVEAALERVRALYPDLPTRRALDFGCGVGRLSQGLARHFSEVVGVDISARMIELARQHNRHGERVRYVHNTQPKLSVFADNEFDFVYSMITLQHMEPIYAKAYLHEFVRITRPGGAILFQIPATRPPPRRRFSWYPPTLIKRGLYVVNRLIPIFPVMEMYAISREEVVHLLRRDGAEVLSVDLNPAAGDTIKSFEYLAKKPL